MYNDYLCKSTNSDPGKTVLDWIHDERQINPLFHKNEHNTMDFRVNIRNIVLFSALCCLFFSFSISQKAISFIWAHVFLIFRLILDKRK